MKTVRNLFSSLLACWLVALRSASGQLPLAVTNPAPADMPHSVVEQDANHKKWQRVTWIPGPSGAYSPFTNSYTEIQTAMSRWAGGQRTDCNPQFQVTAAAAHLSLRFRPIPPESGPRGCPPATRFNQSRIRHFI